MKNAILLHGRPGKEEYYDPAIPSASNAHWYPWLQKQLLINDIKADTPEVPFAFDPQWERWVKEVERFEIGPETILVGHSCGGGFWVKYLSLHKKLQVGKVVLVAPWLGEDYGAPATNFFNNYKIDADMVKRTNGITVFHSDNDKETINSAVKQLREVLKNAESREFHGYGHFTHQAMKTVDFPELLEECLRGNS